MITNVVPGAYRHVSVADVDVPLSADALRRHFLGRECYRRTRYVVAAHAGAHALVEVELADTAPLFSPAVAVTVLAGPDETVFVRRPEVDTGVPSQLARVAAEHPGTRCVVVEGRYSHVSFLLDPAPVVIRVREVVPPFPAKLLDQAQRVLDVAEDLPPILLVPELIDFHELAPEGDVLLPCRGSGVEAQTGTTWYLDQRPPRHGWTLLGCARSREIHRWFYGEQAPNVDVCPRGLGGDGSGPLLTKCCLLEDRIELDDDPDDPASPGRSSRGVRRWPRSERRSRRSPRGGADVGARLSDSAEYADLWGTAEVRAVFDQDARRRRWLDILVVLAEAQAELGIIPRSSAIAIAGGAELDRLDVDFLAAETRRTSHSTLGLINALKAVLPEDAAEHVYYGVTVQDLTDTWTVLAAGQVMSVVWRDLRALGRVLVEVAERHRSTLMPGRTHAQPGAPVTFGWKVASWADEVTRHLERLQEGRARWMVGQLGGAVGTLGFFGDQGPALRAEFCRRLDLRDPGISWLTSRDRVAEQAAVLALVTGTLARIGNEVMELQRDEIGEVREPTSPDVVGSITMPHKRNPERSEHLDTIARLVRAQAGVLLEGVVQIHERDGRAWKAEWLAFPEVCLLTSTALALALDLVGGLEVDAERMRANVDAGRGSLSSERVLSAYAAKVGKHRAQTELQAVLATARRDGTSLAEAVVTAGIVEPDDADALTADTRVPTAEHDVDTVARRVRAYLAATPEVWR